MNNDNFSSLGGRELTDQELMQIQGGGFWSTVWNGVKDGVNAVIHPVVETVEKIKDFFTDPFGTLGIPDPRPRPYPQRLPPFPQR